MLDHRAQAAPGNGWPTKFPLSDHIRVYESSLPDTVSIILSEDTLGTQAGLRLTLQDAKRLSDALADWCDERLALRAAQNGSPPYDD